MKSPGLAQHKVEGSGSKDILSVLLDITVAGVIPISTPLIPGPVNPACERGSIVYWILIQNTHSVLKSPATALQDIAPWLELQLHLQKASLPFYLASCLGMVAMRHNEWISGAWAHCFASLTLKWVSCRSSTVWNAMRVAKTDLLAPRQQFQQQCCIHGR